MGRIVVTEFVSLDGVIEDPGGSEGFEHGGWTFRFDRGAEGDQCKLDELMEAEAQLLGRVTYEAFARAWPTMQDPVGFADKMNGMPKYVVSTTLRDEDACWENSRVIRGDVMSELRRSRDGCGATSWSPAARRWCGPSLRTGWSTSSVSMVFPIVLGSGRRLFGDVPEPDDGAGHLRLEDCPEPSATGSPC